jgi:hypothetical protein
MMVLRSAIPLPEKFCYFFKGLPRWSVGSATLGVEISTLESKP